jgi:hypothetical protein
VALTEDQIRRYQRHLVLPEIGGRGQERLLAASVRVEGRGPAAEECARYLVAAGVGRVVVDPRLDRTSLDGMNPDVVVSPAGQGPPGATQGEAELATQPLGLEAGRLAGAMAAAAAVLQLVGREIPGWRHEPWHGGEEGPWAQT